MPRALPGANTHTAAVPEAHSGARGWAATDPDSEGQRQRAEDEGVLDASEATHRALAREIHDDIGGPLAALNFDLAWLDRHPGDAGAPARLRCAREALGQAMEAMQRVVRGLHPPDLSEGLVAALGLLAANAQRRFGLQVVVDAADPRLDGLPTPVRLTAYRTVQEALTNAARHACCQVVSVRAACDAATATAWVEVRDDGRGFAFEPDGFGLRGLTERARSVGGMLDIASRPGQGTTLRLTVPWHLPLGEHGPSEQRQQRGGVR